MQIMSTDLENWTKREFLAFVLLYAATADYEITPEERENIIQRTGKSEMRKAEENLASLSDYDTIQTIVSYKEAYFRNEEEKDELLEDLRNLFESDHNFEIREQNMMRALQRIL